MTISEFGSLGEFIGSIAVLITLVYLAIQLRQSARSARVESINTAMSGHATRVAQLTATPEDATLFRKFCEDFHSLDLNEKGRIHALMQERNASYNNLRLLRDAGTLPDSVFGAIEANWISILRTPGGRAWFEAWKRMMPPDAQAHMTKAIDDPSIDRKPFTEELPWLFRNE